ncbi:MAG: Minf_1886 family protein [Verrucomicrobiota bacterium]
MQKLDFNQALDQIISEDARYARDAYHFLREALDFTIKHRKKSKDHSAHVSGQQLLDGIRLFALREFGPMVPTVFEYWNVHTCEDFGEMVFNLIHVKVFGKTERDSLEDFKGAYTFTDAFVTPFLPGKALPHHRVPLDEPAEELN